MTTGVDPCFVYNWDNKLRSAEIDSSDVLTAVKYDPDGNRVYKETPGTPAVKRKYIVDIAGKLPTILIVMDTGNDNSVVNTYVYANSQVLAQYDGTQEQSNDKHFYLHDRLSSVRLLIDESGDVANTYTYQPYGELIATESAVTTANPFKFTGQWYDEEIDQYYQRARQYDLQTMRFTGRDPIPGKFENPLILNVYLYCLNDPINLVDLTGLAPIVVTYLELRNGMKSFYEDKLEGKILRLKDFEYLDTKWYILDAETKMRVYDLPLPLERYIDTTAEELNYVGVGMGAKHAGWNPVTLIYAIYWHNMRPKNTEGWFPELPKQGEFDWAFYGYDNYDNIRAESFFESHSFGEQLMLDSIRFELF